MKKDNATLLNNRLTFGHNHGLNHISFFRLCHDKIQRHPHVMVLSSPEQGQNFWFVNALRMNDHQNQNPSRNNTHLGFVAHFPVASIQFPAIYHKNTCSSTVHLCLFAGCIVCTQDSNLMISDICRSTCMHHENMWNCNSCNGSQLDKKMSHSLRSQMHSLPWMNYHI